MRWISHKLPKWPGFCMNGRTSQSHFSQTYSAVLSTALSRPVVPDHLPGRPSTCDQTLHCAVYVTASEQSAIQAGSCSRARHGGGITLRRRGASLLLVVCKGIEGHRHRRGEGTASSRWGRCSSSSSRCTPLMSLQAADFPEQRLGLFL